MLLNRGKFAIVLAVCAVFAACAVIFAVPIKEQPFIAHWQAAMPLRLFALMAQRPAGD
jgi:hypothetical protein